MPSDTAAPERRTVLLDEALRLLVDGGIGAITHRSVEKAAGVPHGSVTYWFESRDGLLAALVDRLVAECEDVVGAISAPLAATYAAGLQPDIAQLATAIAAWIDEHRAMHLARLELELAAIRDPRLRARMHDAAAVFWRMCEPIAQALGSDDPRRDGRAMTAMLDGLLLDRLAHPPQGADVVEATLRRVLLAPT
ncbi:MAG TPA: TetR family transcriptional regulator [Baekduia sp.]|nr:TetR family transcriptional regulator [Baekduia sp.]